MLFFPQMSMDLVVVLKVIYICQSLIVELLTIVWRAIQGDTGLVQKCLNLTKNKKINLIKICFCLIFTIVSIILVIPRKIFIKNLQILI